MDVLWFAIGYGARIASGQAIGRSSTEDSNGILAYALHPVKDENDALQKIKEAYSRIDVPTPDFVGFDEDGDLVQRVQTTNWRGKPKIAEEVNDYVKLLKFMNLNTLRVEVYEDAEDQTPYDEGMGIHNYLSQP